MVYWVPQRVVKREIISTQEKLERCLMETEKTFLKKIKKIKLAITKKNTWHVIRRVKEL